MPHTDSIAPRTPYEHGQMAYLLARGTPAIHIVQELRAAFGWTLAQSNEFWDGADYEQAEKHAVGRQQREAERIARQRRA